MRTLCAIMLLLLGMEKARADGDYAISRIPLPLRINANAVLRADDTRFEIISAKETVLRKHYAISILNENGDDWSEMSEIYDRFIDIESIEGTLYDANGKQIKKVKKKDIEDLSAVMGSDLMTDNRLKRHNFYHRNYPYTIEYRIEIRYSSTMFFPVWAPQTRDGMSVEQSSMTIISNSNYNFRSKAFNYPSPPVVMQERNTRATKWEVKNLVSIVREPYSPRWHELSTMVIFGPSEFQVNNYKGNMASWQDFGKFFYSLKSGRDQLPDNVRSIVHSLTDRVSDPSEKVRLLYKYLQQHTRYISIQLGIGGWQPLDAFFVAANAYGDCKALTNFMAALLKEAGIPSYDALVRAGRYSNYITEDFPSSQFNHVILCVPLKKDSIWLECTSQTLPAGYLSDFTADRYALMVDEGGGKLVRTPRYGIRENFQSRRIQSRLDDDGTLRLTARSQYEANQQDAIHGIINQLSREKVKEYLHEQLDFATYDVNDFKYVEDLQIIPTIGESLDITVSNYATFTGKRLFIVPDIMTRSTQKPAPDPDRKYDVILADAYREMDTVEIEVPKGFEAESIPPDIALSTVFGKYECSTRLQDNKITYYRRFEHQSGRFPAAQYNALVKFYETVFKADRARMVLIRK